MVHIISNAVTSTFDGMTHLGRNGLLSGAKSRQRSHHDTMLKLNVTDTKRREQASQDVRRHDGGVDGNASAGGEVGLRIWIEQSAPL